MGREIEMDDEGNKIQLCKKYTTLTLTWFILSRLPACGACTNLVASFDKVISFPVGLPNRLISAGLEPVQSHTEKSYIKSYYRQFSTNIKIKIIKFC